MCFITHIQIQTQHTQTRTPHTTLIYVHTTLPCACLHTRTYHTYIYIPSPHLELAPLIFAKTPQQHFTTIFEECDD